MEKRVYSVIVSSLFAGLLLLGTMVSYAHETGTWEGRKVNNKIFLADAWTWPYQIDLVKHMKHGKFYIPIQDENKVAVIDPEKPGYIVKIIPVKFNQPHHPWMAPGLRYVYINYQSEGKGDHDAFTVIDTRTNTVVKDIRNGINDPFHGSYNTVQDLYITGDLNPKAGNVHMIDTNTHKLVASIKTMGGKQTRDIIQTRDGRYAFIGHQRRGSTAIDVLDVEKRKIIKSIPCVQCGSLKMNPQGTLFIATSATRDKKRKWQPGHAMIIDVAKMEVVKKIPVGRRPRNISFSNDGKKAYIGVAADGKIAVIDMEKMELKKLLDSGKGANFPYPHPYAPVLVMGNDGTDSHVTIVDMDTDTVIGRIEAAGKATHNATWSADGRFLVISNRLGSTVTILKWEGGKKITKVDDVEVGFGTNGVHWAPYFSGVEYLTLDNIKKAKNISPWVKR